MCTDEQSSVASSARTVCTSTVKLSNCGSSVLVPVSAPLWMRSVISAVYGIFGRQKRPCHKINIVRHLTWHSRRLFGKCNAYSVWLHTAATKHVCQSTVFCRMEQIVILNLSSLRSSIFWDITPCSPLKINRSCRGKRCLPFQDRRISQAKDQHELGSKYLLPALF
jgi:hypothetical protein